MKRIYALGAALALASSLAVAQGPGYGPGGRYGTMSKMRSEMFKLRRMYSRSSPC